MPNLKASIKDVRKTKKRTAKNAVLKRRVKEISKKFVATTGEGDKKELLSSAYKAIDKAAKAGVFHRNKAARKKSQLARALAK